MKDLGLVANVAACCMVIVMFFGSFYNSMQPVRKITVPCSVTLKHMAKKFNVTLMDECILEN